MLLIYRPTWTDEQTLVMSRVARDGHIVWTHDFLEFTGRRVDFGVMLRSAHALPLMNQLVLVVSDYADNFVVALDPETGNVRWRTTLR